MGGWVQVVNESSLILINGCLCCNASLYADFPESRGRVRSQFRGDDVGRDASRQMHWRAPRRRGPDAVDASPPSRDKRVPQVLRGVLQGRALLLRQALLFQGGRAAAHVLRVVRRQGGLLPVRIMLLRSGL